MPVITETFIKINNQWEDRSTYIPSDYIKSGYQSDNQIHIFGNYHNFINAVEKCAGDHLKKRYLSDKSKRGAEFANSHYSTKPRFKDEWLKLEEDL